MSDTNTGLNINLDEIKAQVATMDMDALREMVTKAKVRQRVATKKYYNPETAKKARLKAAAQLKAAEEALKAAGLWGQVENEIKARVDEELGAAEAEAESEPVEA